MHDFAKKTFEIRTVLYENDLVANGTCHNQSSFLSAQDSCSSQLNNPTPERYF